MEPLSVRQLAKLLDVSVGTAQSIMSLDGLPDPSKFSTEHGYLRRVAKLAAKHGICAGAIESVAFGGKKSNPKKATDVGRAGARAGDDTDDLSALESNIAEMDRALQTMEASMNGGCDPVQLGMLSDRYAKLLREKRQSQERADTMRRERGLWFRRDDVYETTAALWMAFRSVTDAIVAQLAEAPNLPSWIEEIGGNTGGDLRRFQSLVRDRVERLVAGQVNAMADGVASVACPAALSDAVSAECRVRLAEELRRIADEVEAQ